MKKPKALKHIGSICFFVASLILAISNLFSDSLLKIRYETIRSLSDKLYELGISRYGVLGQDHGYLYAALIFIACLLIIIGFLSEKKRYITIGAILGIVTHCLSTLRLLNSMEAFLYRGRWRWHYYSPFSGPSLPFELLFALFFVFLLLCSLDFKHGRIYGIIGAVLILARLVPSGYLTRYYYPTSGFVLPPWAIAASVLFAIGSILLGVFFAQYRVIKPDKHNYSIEGATKIDKIVRLKELLDIGAITQEEFEAKKRQIIER